MNQRQQLIEQIRQQSIHARAKALREAAQNQFSNTAVAGAAGGASGGGGGGSRTQYWIQTLFVPDGFDNQIYLQSLTMDSSGSVYSLSNPNFISATPGLLTRRFANNGSLTWQSLSEVTSYVDNTGGTAQKTLIYQGHLYSLYSTIITKQTLSGELVWQSSWNADTGEGTVFRFTGFVIDAQGSIFICGEINANDETYIHKASSLTGEITKTVQLSVDASADTFFHASPLIDSSGNIIVACNWPGYYSTIVKIDPTLTTILGSFTMDDAAFSGEGEVTAMTIDQNDIVVVNQYGESIYALDTNTNSVFWTKQNDSGENSYHLATTVSGSVYWVGEIDWDQVGGEDVRRIITILKFTPFGVFEWGTGIRYVPEEIDFEVTGWDDDGTSGAQIIRDALLITAELQLDGPDTETILKLPLTQVLGTYGDYEFFDITGEVSFNSPTPVEIPVIASLSPASSPIIVNYVPVEVAMTQTKIIDKI